MMTVRLRVILITPARKDAAPISAYVPVYTSPNAALSTGPESQKCLALSTHRGVLLQLRLPFGSSSAPAYFQELIDQLTSDLKGVAVYIHVDDILVSVVSAVEHFENLRVLMQRLQDKGIRYRQENRRWSRISKFYVYSLWVFVIISAEFLMLYRRTPLSLGYLPSELLNGRQIRCSVVISSPHYPGQAGKGSHRLSQMIKDGDQVEKLATIFKVELAAQA
eukprot:Em0008g458a